MDQLTTLLRDETDNERLCGTQSELERVVDRLCRDLSSLRSSTRARGSNERHR